jgi:hypothetical protein
MTMLSASEEFLSKFPSSRYLSLSGSYPLDLSSLGDPAGSNATADLALMVTGTHKPLHRDKVEIPSGGMCHITVKTIFFIVLLYVIRACQSLISMQTDDNTGQLSTEHADRGGIFRNTTCLENEKNKLI